MTMAKVMDNGYKVMVYVDMGVWDVGVVEMAEL